MAEEMVRKGARKYRAKVPTMEAHYEAAKERAKAGYRDVGFVREVTEAYEKAWDEYMVDNYKDVMGPEKADKWAKSWSRKMFGREITP